MESEPRSGERPLPPNHSGERCKRCSGTGLVCGHVPVIGPGSCCADYANAICPECNGRGIRRVISDKSDE